MFLFQWKNEENDVKEVKAIADLIVSKPFGSLDDILFIIAGIAGVIGAFKIYYKMNQGGDVTKDIITWGLVVVFCIVGSVMGSNLYTKHSSATIEVEDSSLPPSVE